MYLGDFSIKTIHKRTSKLGKTHSYHRKKRYAKLRCDACEKEFERERRRIDPSRLSNNYFHVCGECDAKRFAQKRGVEKRKMWSLTASSNLPIGKL